MIIRKLATIAAALIAINAIAATIPPPKTVARPVTEEVHGVTVTDPYRWLELETQHPNLVKAVVCSYPLVDMLRFHKFLVGGFWVPEYGSADDAEQFKTIYAYSPYQHVTKGTKYPATLFITGDADTRVAPLHARKMAALMQASTGSDNPVLIRYHVSGGHSGGEPLKVQVNNSAESLAFLAWQLK